MELNAYPEWQYAIAELAGAEGTVLLIGDTDTGKTTFSSLLVNAALEAGRKVAVVDGDVGQSEIGPPVCAGMGIPTGPIRTLSEIAPSALAFVGTTSPRGHLLELATAVRAMADAARAGSPDLLLVDTTGFVRGAAAQRLKHAKIELLAPRHLVALQRRDECEPLLAPYERSERMVIHRLPVPAVVSRKTPSIRSQRRAGRFARYFEGAELRHYDFDEVALTGTCLNTGKPVAPHLARFMANALGLRVYYAEEVDRHLGLVTSGMPHGEQGLALIQEQFRPHAITVTPASRLRHLVTGLSDGNGRLLGIGLIEALDLRRRRIGILTPIRAHGAVRLLQLGILRVQPDGTELGTIRAGEV